MISKIRKTELADQVSDKKLPLSVRKTAYKEQMMSFLNPRTNFDPKTFDPYDDTPDYEVKKRERVEPPLILPDMGMLPKTIMEGQMIGMFESKQDLYLLIAWLSRRVTELEEIVRNNNGDFTKNKT